MGKFIKSIVAGVLALSMATWGTPVWAAVQQSATIPVSVSISSVGSYSISASVPDGAMTFDTSSVSTSSPWVIASDYIEVHFSGPLNDTWGVRIISDNVADLLGLPRDEVTNNLYIDADGDGAYDEGVETTVTEQTTDTSYGTLYYIGYDADGDATIESNEMVAGNPSDISAEHRYYAGLIDPDTQDSPVMRASLAFMVDGYDTSGAATTPSIPDLTILPTDDPAGHGASTYVGDWDDTWYWFGDKSNDQYDDLVDTDQDGTTDTANHMSVYSYYYATGEDRYYFTPNYSLIAYGTPFGRYLGRPGPDEAPDDDDVNSRSLADIDTPSSTTYWTAYVYLAGKFASTAYDSDHPDGLDFVLPAGNYSTNIYLELYNQE